MNIFDHQLQGYNGRLRKFDNTNGMRGGGIRRMYYSRSQCVALVLQSVIIIMSTVAKGERGHPTRTQTRVYRVPNMRSDRHTKEPGSMAWQPESIFNRRDDHIITLAQASNIHV